MRGNETKLGWLRALTKTCSNQFPLRPPRTAAGWATNQVFFWSLHWPEAIPHASGLGVKFQIRFAVCFQHIPAATHLAQFHLNCNGALQHPEVFNLLLREDRERSLLLALLAVDADRTALRTNSTYRKIVRIIESFEVKFPKNMNKWRSRERKSQRGLEKQWKDQRGERMKRKNRQVREKVGKSLFTVFFQMIPGSVGSKK